MSELDRLIEAVEAGTATTMLFKDALGAAIPSADGWAELAYHGSLDAAEVLHEELLPGFDYRLTRDGADYGSLVFKSGYMDDYSENWQLVPDNGPRAWLLAILRAYRDSNQAEGAR